jgi:hypothetical protein
MRAPGSSFSYARAAVLLAAACVAGCARTPAPPPKAAAPPPEEVSPYYPLAPGWKWAYDIEAEGQRILATYSVSEIIGETAIVVAGEDRLGYVVLAEGIARKEGRGLGDFIIKSPVRTGTKWAITGGQAQITAIGKTVALESGTYDNCATVEEARGEPDRITRTTYAPNVGPVVVEQQVLDTGGRYVTILRATLRGVTRPGEDVFAK